MTDLIKEQQPMKETQRSVGEWINQTFPGTDPESPRKAIRALEEMVELCLASGATAAEVNEAVECALLRCGQSERERRKQPDKIPVEAADVLIVLYGVAHMRGFDLHAEVDKKMLINRSRRWAVRGDGTGYHVKEPATEVCATCSGLGDDNVKGRFNSCPACDGTGKVGSGDIAGQTG